MDFILVCPGLKVKNEIIDKTVSPMIVKFQFVFYRFSDTSYKNTIPGNESQGLNKTPYRIVVKKS